MVNAALRLKSLPTLGLKHRVPTFFALATHIHRRCFETSLRDIAQKLQQKTQDARSKQNIDNT